MLERKHNRRIFFGTFSVPLFNSLCSKEQPLPESAIRREVGQWTKTDIEKLARSMLDETDYNDISYAGGVLLGNQRGKPTLSQLAPSFEDKSVKVTTVDTILPEIKDFATSMKARIRTTGPGIEVKLRPREGGPDLRLLAPTKLIYEEVLVNHSLTLDYSDFLVKFLMAKEVLNARAFEMAMEYVTYQVIYPYYEIPKDTSLKKALKLKVLEGKVSGAMPVHFMADIWAHFLMVPNYNLASERGRFSSTDIEGNSLSVFRLAAEAFRRDQVLIKNSQGGYEWTKDSTLFYETWYNLASIGANLLLNPDRE